MRLGRLQGQDLLNFSQLIPSGMMQGGNESEEITRSKQATFEWLQKDMLVM